jgi:hypothetical protein
MWLERLKVIAVLAGLVGERHQDSPLWVNYSFKAMVVTDATLNFNRAAQLQNRER